ncbi:oligosaccharide flippase family protein [Methylobacterium sp. NFXW15]|uniref:oligosaccharide flippase family protein n=1 Tax=Methylobacterium sp. NFXW15 TaxID=2819512 RepID=UPI003CF8025B
MHRKDGKASSAPNESSDKDLRNKTGDNSAFLTDESTDGILIGIEAEAVSADPKTKNEGRRLAVNVLAGGGVNLVKIALQLVMLPLMAHLLGPAEFGIYALALPTVAFFMTLADGGLGASLAREPLESRDVWSTAFWLVLILGVLLGVLIAGWGMVLASLSNEPRVANVMSLLAFSFILVTSAVLPYARLTRERRLVAISSADLAGNLTGAAVAVTLAVSGAGALSLAAQYVTLYLVRSIVLNAIAFVPPDFTFRLTVLKSHISTGSSLVCSRLADFAGRFAENLAFGRMFGPAALGTYTFANQVPRFVCESASNPLWGALYAHALREDDASIRQLHAKLVHILALVVAPVAFFASATVPGLIHMFLGPAWQDAATLLSVLIPFYALNVIASLCGSVLLARGHGWTIFWLTVLLVVARIASVALGYWFGPLGVVWGVSLAQVLFSCLAFLALKRIGILSLRSLMRGILAPVAVGMVAGFICHLVVRNAFADAIHIGLALLAGSAFYVIALFILIGNRLREDFAGIRQLIGR